MPISPTAPDYISQVRGIISDLRQDFLQKKQLAQDEEKTKATLQLQYAQLAAQRENAARQADLSEKQLQFNYAQEAGQAARAQAKLDYDAKAQEYSTYKDAVQQDLNERKYNLDVFKENRSAQKDALERSGKQRANERLARFAQLAAAKDYTGMQQWYADAEKDTMDTMEYGAMINQASQISSGIEAANNLQTVEVVRPELDAFSRDAGNILTSLPNLSSSDRNKQISDIKTRGVNLLTLVRDPTTRDAIKVTLDGIAQREKDIDKEKAIEQLDLFVDDGLDGRLPPTIQAQFDDLYATTPEEERGSDAFKSKRRRLMLQANKSRSNEKILRTAKELAGYELAQLENPSYRITNPDGSVSPKFPAPDLTNVSFESGLLDRNNNISEDLQNEIESYRQQMRTAGVAKKEEDELASIANFMYAAREGKPMPAAPGQAPSAAAPSGKQPKLSNLALLGGGTQGQPVSRPTTQPEQTPQAPSANINDLQANRALLAEVQKQLAEGKRYLEIVNPQTGEVKISQISLATLNASLPGLIRSLEQTSASAGAQEEQR